MLAHGVNPQSACFWKLLLFWKPNLFLHSFCSPFPPLANHFLVSSTFAHWGSESLWSWKPQCTWEQAVTSIFHTSARPALCSFTWHGVKKGCNSQLAVHTRNAAYAGLRWGCSFLGKCPNPNWACRSGHLLKARTQWSHTTETEGTTLGSPAGSSKKG